MKKILAILSGVAMLFAACTPDKGGDTEIVPTFPELQELTVESGKSYEITFTAERAWSVSLPADSRKYATLTYTYEDGTIETDTQFYGEEGEHTIIVNVHEDAVSYAKDIVFTVDMTLGSYTESVAKLTIPLTPYEITVTGTATSGSSRFEKGGHPSDSPFALAPNTYKVTYASPFDGPEASVTVEHNFDKLYNYRIYAKNRDKNGNVLPFGPIVPDAKEDPFPWVRLTTFGVNNNKLRTCMEHSHTKSVITVGVGYEAYVNLEDENGDAIVSIYYIYDPAAVVSEKPAVELAYPDEAAAKGVTFVGSDTAYTLTLPTSDLLGENSKAASLKISGFSGGGYAAENLKLLESEVAGIYYTALAEGATFDGLVRTNTLSVLTVNAEGAKEYTITVIFEWAPEGEEYPEIVPEE